MGASDPNPPPLPRPPPPSLSDGAEMALRRTRVRRRAPASVSTGIRWPLEGQGLCRGGSRSGARRLAGPQRRCGSAEVGGAAGRGVQQLQSAPPN